MYTYYIETNIRPPQVTVLVAIYTILFIPPTGGQQPYFPILFK